MLVGLAQDSEKMKSMIAFKKRLEEQLEKLTAETVEVQATLDTVNTILLEKGFKRGDIKEVAAATSPVSKEVILPKNEPEPLKVVIAPARQYMSETESVIPLKTMNDEPLALMYFDKQHIHVMPDESKKFNVNTLSPFLSDLLSEHKKRA